MIEEDPPLLARIAAGELPESFLQKLQDKGIDLIPRKWSEMDRVCTCPDWGDPCKHMAALYYVIAREIDADPHVLFRLRGMDLAARFGKAAVHQIEPPFTITFAQKKPAPAAPLAEPLELAEIPNCGELISALLPPAPTFCERDFALVMAEFYHRFALYRTWEYSKTNEAEIEHRFSRSRWTVLCEDTVIGTELELQGEDINGKTKNYSLQEAFNYFVHFSSDDGTESYTFLFYLFKFLNLVCSAGAFIPYVLVEEEKLKIIWRPFETLPSVNIMLEAVASRECGILSIKTKGKKTKAEKQVSGRSVVDLLACAFLKEMVRRRFLSFKEAFYKYGTGDEYRDLLFLFFQGIGLDVSSPAQRSLPVAIDRWLSPLHIHFDAYRYSLTVKAINTGKAAEADLQYALSMDLLTEQEDGIKSTPISQVKDLEILRAPTALSNYLPEIRELASPSKTKRGAAVPLSEERLVDFLDSASVLLTRLGMTVTLPKALHRELKPRLVIKGSDTKKKQGSLVRFLGLDALQNFVWQIAIGDQTLTLEEFKKLVNQKRALVRFKDGFVKIDAEEFARLLKKAKDSTPGFNDFLKAHFSGDTILALDTREIVNNLFREREVPIPAALKAKLRPYQKRGFNWLCSLLLSGFGCILADDMGLGKTVQSIAVLLRLKEQGLLGDGCLVVAPAALLGNWEKELERFAPSLGVSRYHGNRRNLDREQDVFLTTYQTAVRDAEKLKNEGFSLLLVDEAHLMKNAETRISRTVKQLRSQYRLALSGTPVENRLEDLRSLFDFILPGYLGSAEEFRVMYRIPIEVMRNRAQAEALRKITAPFLLRRLKTDKAIIKDLPEKIVVNEYATLEKSQAALYESVVAESLQKSDQMERAERSSLILTLLTSLKQICDHPRVFDKESPAVSGLSGKAQLLLALLEEILANREKALVFSQYVETLDCLEKIIKSELGEQPLIYHGGLSQGARSEVINRFQNESAARILLISLRAGGLGLNLTSASRVIHYDLWYNPAVENQATDRAFRIGQKRNVFVHRFITKNSFEEKIDAMIISKRELADMTVASGESWIARMSHEELKALFDRK
jgi:SNF2 family DNA or RNA helicase